MDNSLLNLRVNSARFESDFVALAKIGRSDDGGINRPAFGNAHVAARDWFKKRISDADLEFRTDSAKNHSAFLESGPKDAKTLLVGSHLDSVPDGGRFDGALGVIAALEVLRVVKEAAIPLPVHLEAIDFTDTEGARFERLGSSALCGRFNSVEASFSGEEEFFARLEEAGITKDELFKAKRNPDLLAGFIELHIEQGRRLSDAGHQIGVVSNIVGDCSYEFFYRGRAAMSASTPMKDRQDALIGASAFTLAVSQLVMIDFPDCAANVSDIRILPGKIDMIPSQAEIALKFWAPDERELRRLENAIIKQGHLEADKYGLELETRLLSKHPPISLSPKFQKAITHVAQNLGLSHTPVVSRANHDSQSLGKICPTGMIFIPSVKGISHSPQEFSHWNDCINGTNVLLQTIFEICGQLMTSHSP